MGCHAFFQRIFLTQGSNPCLWGIARDFLHWLGVDSMQLWSSLMTYRECLLTPPCIFQRSPCSNTFGREIPKHLLWSWAFTINPWPQFEFKVRNASIYGLQANRRMCLSNSRCLLCDSTPGFVFSSLPLYWFLNPLFKKKKNCLYCVVWIFIKQS